MPTTEYLLTDALHLYTSTQSSDFNLSILSDSPGSEDTKIGESRLPCFKQVLCFMANLEKPRREDKSKKKKWIAPCANLVVWQVINHHRKTGIPTIHKKKMAKKIVQLYADY